MTQENKELLIKDLCARLPYKVKCCIYNFGEDTIRIKEDVLWSVQGDNILTLKSCVENGEAYMYHQIKPYLFPLSSMTDKDLAEFLQIKGMNLNSDELKTFRRETIAIVSILPSYSRHIDWLNSHHFDYRGLIEKELAIDATGLNVY